MVFGSISQASKLISAGSMELAGAAGSAERGMRLSGHAGSLMTACFAAPRIGVFRPLRFGEGRLHAWWEVADKRADGSAKMTR
jgi:hypothetical protein